MVSGDLLWPQQPPPLQVSPFFFFFHKKFACRARVTERVWVWQILSVGAMFAIINSGQSLQVDVSSLEGK